jgi:uncharacterized protein DUF4406
MSFYPLREIHLTALQPQFRRPKRIYIAGPYTQGDPVVNTRRAISAGTALLQRGFVPFVPHLTMFWHLVEPQEYETWLTYDFEWVKACDGLLRLDGPSSGADREVALAKEVGIPIFYSLDLVCAYQWKV